MKYNVQRNTRYTNNEGLLLKRMMIADVSSSRVAIEFCSYMYVNYGLPVYKVYNGVFIFFVQNLCQLILLIDSTSAVTAAMHPVPGDWYFYSNLLSDCHSTFLVLAVRMAVKIHIGSRTLEYEKSM